MKLRSAPLDDNWNGLQFDLDDDGRWLARLIKKVFTVTYAAFNGVIVFARRYGWRRGALESRRRG